MVVFRKKLILLTTVNAVTVFQSCSTSKVPLSTSENLLSFLILATSWKAAYSSPPAITPLNILSNTSEVVQNATFPQYGNIVNPLFVDHKAGRNTTRRGRKSRLRNEGSKKSYSQNKRNDHEDSESLRTQILSRLGSVDPLLCLPKALCGISSRQQQSSRDVLEGSDHHPLPLNQVDNYLHLMQTVMPTEEHKDGSRKNKRKKSSKSSSSQETSSSEESKSVESQELSRDDIEYYKEKAEVENLMTEADYEQDTNWWDTISVHNTDPYSLDTSPTGGEATSTAGSPLWPSMPSLATGVTRLVRSMMPSMSWGFGNNRDVFGDDPFFKDRSGGRSLNSQIGSRWSFGKKSGRKAYTIHKKRNKNKRKKAYLDEKKKEMNEIDDPTAKFELAVEIGKKLDSPKQCDYIFNGCPFSYQEILEIIDKNSSQNSSLIPDPSEQAENFDGNEKEEETLKRPPKPISRGKNRLMKHKMPGGEELEIRFKISDPHLLNNNGLLNPPRIAVIPNSEIREKLGEEKMSSFHTRPNKEYSNSLLYRNDFSQSVEVTPTEKTSPQITVVDSINFNGKLQGTKKPTRQPKRPRKKWGKQKENPGVWDPINPYLFNQLNQSPPPHVTNYNYYSSNGPKTRYTYEPHRPLPIEPTSHPLSRNSPQLHEPQPHRQSMHSLESNQPHLHRPSRYSHQAYSHEPSKYFHQPSYDGGESGHPPSIKSSPGIPSSEPNSNDEGTSKVRTKYPLAESSEERIIIRLPESPNNNYYNWFPLGSNYNWRPQPSFLSRAPLPFVPTPGGMYPQSHLQFPLGPLGAYPPYPSTPSSLLSYLWGKK